MGLSTGSIWGQPESKTVADLTKMGNLPIIQSNVDLSPPSPCPYDVAFPERMIIGAFSLAINELLTGEIIGEVA